MMGNNSRMKIYFILMMFILTFLPLFSLMAGAQNTEDISNQTLGNFDQRWNLSKVLSEETRRQQMICRRMDDLIERFQEIIADLVSNELLEEAKGQQLLDTVSILRILNEKHVPEVAKCLENALKRLETLQPNLETADKEIQIILLELEKLIEKLNTGNLINELEEIIQREKQLYNDTKNWESEIQQSSQQTENQSNLFAERQDRIVQKIGDFQKELREAIQTKQNTTDSSQNLNLQNAYNTLQQKNPEGLLKKAARAIANRNPSNATQKQQEALNALEEAKQQMGQNPSDALEEMQKGFRDDLAQALKEQTELRQDTERVPSNNFQRQRKNLLPRQRELRNRLENMMDSNLPEQVPASTSPQLQELMQQAHQNTKQAAKQMSSNQKRPAVQSQKETEKNLQDAVDLLEQQMASMPEDFPNPEDLAQEAQNLAQKQNSLKEQTEQTPNQSLSQRVPQQNDLHRQAENLAQKAPTPQFQESARQMQQAAQSLQQGQKREAMQHQQQAAQLLQEGTQALQNPSPNLEDLSQQAQALAQKQNNLKEQTQQTSEQSLSQRAPQQNNLQKQAENLVQQAPTPQFQESVQQMQKAAQALQQGQKQEAVQHQEKAEQSLQEGTQELKQAQNENLENLAQRAQDLAQQQNNLEEQTQQAPEQSLPQLNSQQENLQEQAENLAQEAPIPQFQESAQQMQQASQALQQGQKGEAMGHQQQASQALQEGTQALQSAQNANNLMAQQSQLMNETSQAGEGMLPQIGKAQGNLGQQAQAMEFPQAAQQMAMASQALKQGQRQQAMQHQQQAVDAIKQQMGQMGARDMMSAMRFQPFGKSSPYTKPVSGSGLNETAYRYFEQSPMGFKQRGDANWNPLPQRELEAFYQKYAHELPTEYRKLLEEYYETLSE